MSQSKPWRSIDQQCQTLIDRGMIIDDKALALHTLQNLGYYRLSGYWYPFRMMGQAQGNTPTRTDQFYPDTAFEDVIKLYAFDKTLRFLALDALERIELALRVDVAHLLGKRDPLAHLSPRCLGGHFAKHKGKDGQSLHDKWLKTYYRQVHRARREPFVVHHHAHYGGQLPIWVAIEVWDFGALSRLFSGLRRDDKQLIAHKYGLADGDLLAKWLRSLNLIRNICAHHSRLWNINIKERSPCPSDWKAQDNSRLFYYLIVMNAMLDAISPKSGWQYRLHTHLANFPAPKNQCIGLADLGVKDLGDLGAFKA